MLRAARHFSKMILSKRILSMSAFFISTLFIRSISVASVQVAFLEARDAQGNLIQLEPGGRFWHVAISYEGQWLQAHPYYGVILSSLSDLQKMGNVSEIVTVNDHDEPTAATVNFYLGRPYDSQYSWTDDKIYCSELVAKILGLAPRPMYFDPALWPESFQKYNGEPGSSPDYLYHLLTQPKLNQNKSYQNKTNSL